MKKIYYLSTCSTCKRIIKQLQLDESIEQQDLKTEKLSLEQLKEMVKLSGNYESLFSKRARKYRELGLTKKTLSEDDYRRYLLAEYTFLQRPVLILDEKIFIGNSKKTIDRALTALTIK